MPSIFEGSNLIPMVNLLILTSQHIGRFISQGYLVGWIFAHSNHYAYLNLYVVGFGITSREVHDILSPAIHRNSQQFCRGLDAARFQHLLAS